MRVEWLLNPRPPSPAATPGKETAMRVEWL